ncbi:MAG: fimbria major subunit, partial [Mucinivorans sp.]
NHFKFTIQRAVSKVRAKLNNADVLKIVGTGTLADPMATLTATQYTVRNLNKALTPIQLFATDGILEPSETDVTSPQAAHFNLFDKWTPGATETATVKDLSKKDNFYPYYDRASDIDQTLATTDQANYVFASENTNNKQVVGNTTYLAIKAIYNPKNWVTACTYDATGDGGFTITTEAATAATTFHAVNFTGLKQIGGTTNFQLTNNIFKDDVIAKRILTEVLAANKLYPDGGASIGTTDPTQISENKAKYDAEFAARFSTYTGGACYYRLNIGRSDGVKTIYGIRRNGKYEITINSFKQLGVATEGKLDDTPEVPVSSQDTYVTATISVAPWKTYTQGGDL